MWYDEIITAIFILFNTWLLTIISDSDIQPSIAVSKQSFCKSVFNTTIIPYTKKSKYHLCIVSMF